MLIMFIYHTNLYIRIYIYYSHKVFFYYNYIIGKKNPKIDQNIYILNRINKIFWNKNEKNKFFWGSGVQIHWWKNFLCAFGVKRSIFHFVFINSSISEILFFDVPWFSSFLTNAQWSAIRNILDIFLYITHLFCHTLRIHS